jgi:hypothetical protein
MSKPELPELKIQVRATEWARVTRERDEALAQSIKTREEMKAIQTLVSETLTERDAMARDREESFLLLARISFLSERFIRRYTSKAKRASKDGVQIFEALDEVFDAVAEWLGQSPQRYTDEDVQTEGPQE